MLPNQKKDIIRLGVGRYRKKNCHQFSEIAFCWGVANCTRNHCKQQKNIVLVPTSGIFFANVASFSPCFCSRPNNKFQNLGQYTNINNTMKMKHSKNGAIKQHREKKEKY